MYGRWQEGIEPAIGLTAGDRDQFRRLARHDGRRCARRDASRFRSTPDFRRRMPRSIACRSPTWLAEHRFDSKPLLWYANYVCRDDYGALASDVSAWAGLHYFSSRDSDDKGPLTWPEGNGWIVKQLLARVGRFVRAGQPVRAIGRDESERSASAPATPSIVCRAVIFAAPTFLAPYLIEGMAPLRALRVLALDHREPDARLDSRPRSRRAGVGQRRHELADARLRRRDAPVAAHGRRTGRCGRSTGRSPRRTPSANRQMLLEKDWAYWKEAILTDLERVHPRIRACVSRLDVMRIGHAMVRPTVGAVFSAERQALKRAHADGLVFAHSDVSGLSLFEEAQYRGVTAADRALARVLGPPGPPPER